MDSLCYKVRRNKLASETQCRFRCSSTANENLCEAHMTIQKKSALIVGFIAEVIILIAAGATGFAQSPAENQNFFRGMEWRLIGPFRGGRVETVTGIPNDP